MNIAADIAAELSHVRYTKENAAQLFSDDIGVLLDRSTDQVVVMLDEIEHVTPDLAGALARHWDDDFVIFWQVVRGVSQERRGKFRFVIAGVNPRCLQASTFGNQPNPIFEFAQTHVIDPFDTRAVREMIERIGNYSGVKFEDNVFDYIHDQYGGYPYLTRLACGRVVNLASSAQTSPVFSVDDFVRRTEDISVRLYEPISDMLLSFVWWFEDEYYLLEQLAEGDEEFVEGYLTENPPTAVRLRRFGILRDSKLAVPSMGYYLRHYGGQYRARVSPYTRTDVEIDVIGDGPDFDILGELTSYRMKLEVKLRRVIILVIGVAAGLDDQRIAQMIGSAAGVRQNGVDPADFFVGISPHKAIENLYLSELGKVIENSYELFIPFFGAGASARGEFKKNFREVVKARNAESHTRTVTAKEMDRFRPAYRWCISKLQTV